MKRAMHSFATGAFISGVMFVDGKFTRIEWFACAIVILMLTQTFKDCVFQDETKDENKS